MIIWLDHIKSRTKKREIDFFFFSPLLFAGNWTLCSSVSCCEWLSFRPTDRIVQSQHSLFTVLILLFWPCRWWTALVLTPCVRSTQSHTHELYRLQLISVRKWKTVFKSIWKYRQHMQHLSWSCQKFWRMEEHSWETLRKLPSIGQGESASLTIPVNKLWPIKDRYLLHVTGPERITEAWERRTSCWNNCRLIHNPQAVHAISILFFIFVHLCSL